MTVQITSAQIKEEIGNIIGVKAYNKEISLFKAKEFVVKEIFGKNNAVTKFEIYPMEAATSGELTTVYYKCDSLFEEGIVFVFYGDYINDFGLLLKGYGFKNFDKEKGLELLNKIEDAKIKNKDYINEDGDNHNIYITYDDVTILIYRKDQQIRSRVFWKDFDAEWGDFAFKRTKKYFEQKVKE